MIGDETLEAPHHRLAHAWEAHHELRRAHPPVASLAESSARRYQTRMGMWDWRSLPTARTG